ncbi:phage tail protein [Enterococcus sp. DIV1420a]|uniref:phage tail protein n=1 Tax=Enterococcus sp. DIV1420a TaxID=2774672 RepID=UPI003F23ECB3
MNTQVVSTFTPMEISQVSLKFKKNDQLISFGCAGVLSSETEMAFKQVKCGIQTIKRKGKPVQLNVKLTGHARTDTVLALIGLSNEGLKPGIYSYNEDSSSGDFTLTADVIDDFDDVTKLVAFPKCTSESGLQFTVDRTADEYQMVEYSFTAMFTKINGKLRAYVEAFTDQISEEIANKWRTSFSEELVSDAADAITETV